jgi:hypothetical protein
MTIGEDIVAARNFLSKVNPSSEGIKASTSYSKVPLIVS